MSTAWIEKKGSTLRLRWWFEGELYQLPLGVKDNVAGNAYAKIVAGTIERDIECGNFDKTKERYQNPNKRTKTEKFRTIEILPSVRAMLVGYTKNASAFAWSL
jgi:Arm DNA-binding domain